MSDAKKVTLPATVDVELALLTYLRDHDVVTMLELVVDVLQSEAIPEGSEGGDDPVAPLLRRGQPDGRRARPGLRNGVSPGGILV